MHYPKLTRPHRDLLEVFAEEKSTEHGFLRASAPMVRYSKLEFRKLLRLNGVKLCFTPMIVADSFINSQKARENEFTTTIDDEPVVAQFAARNVQEFVTASQLIYRWVDGVDLNCGCPQSWAIARGYGCGLLRQPELIYDIIRTLRRTLPGNFSISLKMRLLNGATSRTTVEFARQLEKCGVTFITLHGRTMWQRSSDPLNIDAMTAVKQSIQVPLIVNGNVRSWSDACSLYEQTKADGVMAARGLLSNPTIFNTKYKDFIQQTPMDCVQDWLDIGTSAKDNISFQCFHHHLTFMCASFMKRSTRTEFNNFTKKQQILDFFDERYNTRPTKQAAVDPFEYTKCIYTQLTKDNDDVKQKTEGKENHHWDGSTNGKYFNEFKNEINVVASKKNDKDEQQFDLLLEDSFFTEY